MTAKFYALISIVGPAISCVVQAQSPAPGESPPESPVPAEKGASASPQAEKAASPSRAESPTASPKARPTPKKAKAEGKPPPGCKPSRARNRESHESAGTRRWSWLGMG